MVAAMSRRAGILCPLFSVPGNQGIGDLGQKTLKMIDAIADAGYSVWQMLPLQHTGYSHSPYQTISSFAGDPIYINLDRLAEAGLLAQSSIVNCNKFRDYVDYEEVRKFKEVFFRRAFRSFKKNYADWKDEFEAFKKEAFWLDDWTYYYLFRTFYEGRPWNEWEEEYKNFPLEKDGEKQIDLKQYQDEMLYIQFLQFMFYRQFDEVARYARSKGVKLMGDVPFYVDYDSADVWAMRENFLLDAKGNPRYVGGLPPDAFNAEGTRWGMPVYNFSAQQKNHYVYWMKRMKWMERCFDMVRLGHFRGFDTFWAIPARGTAAEGKWVLGPREELMHKIRVECPRLELVAEVLGMMRPEVRELEREFSIPGMDVLQYRMEARQLKRPVEEDVVLYTGTHDHASLEELYGSFDNNRRISLRRFFKKRGYPYRAFHDMVVHYALDTEAELVMLPVQDIMGLKGQARTNNPAEDPETNWTWKLKDFKQLPKDLMKTREWVESSGRLPETKAAPSA